MDVLFEKKKDRIKQKFKEQTPLTLRHEDGFPLGLISSLVSLKQTSYLIPLRHELTNCQEKYIFVP